MYVNTEQQITINQNMMYSVAKYVVWYDSKYIIKWAYPHIGFLKNYLKKKTKSSDNI